VLDGGAVLQLSTRLVGRAGRPGLHPIWAVLPTDRDEGRILFDQAFGWTGPETESELGRDDVWESLTARAWAIIQTENATDLK